MTDTSSTVDQQPIRTLAFEYAAASNYECKACKKSIIRRSLCINAFERTSRKQKKKALVPVNSCHFKCWIVPNDFKMKPLETYRGYSVLKDSDKKRMARLYSAGTGASWPAILAADEQERQAEEEAKAAAEGNEIDTVESTAPKNAKSMKRKRSTEENDEDMTTALTGVQTPKATSSETKTKKVKSSDKKMKTASKGNKEKTKVKENKKENKTENKKDNKKESKKESEPKQVKKKNVNLDDLHGEGFQEDFQNILSDLQKVKK